MVTEILIAGSVSDSCRYAFDGACDEPAYCAYGTDTTDCSGSSSVGHGGGSDSCEYAFDGACDEPAYCAYGTDSTDCGGSSSAGHGDESNDSYWTNVPDALACISINQSVGSLPTQFIVNNCNHQVHVRWCYADRPDHDAQCDPGPPGLGFMDHGDHIYVTPTSPDFYQSSWDLSPKPDGDRVYGFDHSPILEPGIVNYIACGYEHIEGATRYEMQWDAYTGRFRCLAHFPREEPYVSSDQTVE